MPPLICHALADYNILCGPCVDCGLKTGNYCETLLQTGEALWQGGTCLARLRVPSEYWEEFQRTPLCTKCENKYGACHFCRGTSLCQPFPRGARNIEPGVSGYIPVYTTSDTSTPNPPGEPAGAPDDGTINGRSEFLPTTEN